MDASEKGEQVLLVDDDQLLLDMYATKFKEKSYVVKTSLDGKGALRVVEDGFTPDLILIDVVMPGIDGFELLAELKKLDGTKKATFIMLSNQGQDADIDEAKKLGADCYIIKASAIPSEVVERAHECRVAHAH